MYTVGSDTFSFDATAATVLPAFSMRIIVESFPVAGVRAIAAI